MDFPTAMTAGSVDTATALAIFDGLEAADTNFMLGNWKGASFPTNHPMDGLLETYHWHGKRFIDAEKVHPLVCRALGGKMVCLNPVFMLPLVGPMGRGSLPKSTLLGALVALIMPLFGSRKARARLRMTEYRGKSSATMVYDNLPINDIFRKVDDNTVLGVMDLKTTDQPFFFVLRREQAVLSEVQ